MTISPLGAVWFCSLWSNYADDAPVDRVIPFERNQRTKVERFRASCSTPRRPARSRNRHLVVHERASVLAPRSIASSVKRLNALCFRERSCSNSLGLKWLQNYSPNQNEVTDYAAHVAFWHECEVPRRPPLSGVH